VGLNVLRGLILPVTLCVGILLLIVVLLIEGDEVPVRDAVKEREPVGVEEPVLEVNGLALTDRVDTLVLELDADLLDVREDVVVLDASIDPDEDFVALALGVIREETVFDALTFEDKDAMRLGSLDRDGLDDIVEVRVDVAVRVGMAAMTASSRARGSWTEESRIQSNG
jgi:hypothetical protein